MVRVEPTPENSLTETSEINAAQVMTIQKNRLMLRRGQLSAEKMKLLEQKLAYMLSISVN